MIVKKVGGLLKGRQVIQHKVGTKGVMQLLVFQRRKSKSNEKTSLMMVSV